MSNLLEKASIIHVPAGYNEGSINAVKPKYEISSTEVIANNDFTDGGNNWTIQNDVTFSNDTAIIDATSGNAYINQNALTVGFKYKVSITLDSLDGPSNKICDLINASGTIYQNLSVGVNEFEIEANQTAFRIRARNNAIAVISNTSVRKINGADFTFDRGTTATRINKDSLVENVQILGSELVVNGDFATDSNWVVGNGWSIDQGNGKASYDDTVNGFILTDDVLTIGKKYRVNFNLLDTGGNTIRLSVTSTTGGDFQDYTDGDGLFTKVITASTNYVRIGGGTSGVAFSITNVSVKEITEDTDLPRINYQGGVGHWLIEPSSTNSATYSQDFSLGRLFESTNTSPPGLTNSVISTATINSPDGTANATKFNDSGVGGNGPVVINYYNTKLSTTDNNTLSIFAKKGTKNYLILSFSQFTTQGDIYFDLNIGSIANTATTFVDSKIEDYGDGWYRCSVTVGPQTDNTGIIRVYMAQSDSNNNVTRDGNSNIFIWGIQSEISSRTFPTSYIPTDGSPVTRDAEAANGSGNSTMFNDSEGVLYAEIAALSNDQTERSISLASGGNNDRVTLQYNLLSNTIQGLYRDGGSNVGDVSFALSDITNFSKIAFKYKTNDFALWIDGVEVDTDPTGTTQNIGLIALTLDRTNSNLQPFYGKIKCIAVFKEALTDAELECLTTTSTNQVLGEYKIYVERSGGVYENEPAMQSTLNELT